MSKKAVHEVNYNTISKFCALAGKGVHCYGANAQKVSLLPDIDIVLVLCDEHKIVLARRAAEIREAVRELQSWRARGSAA